MSYQLPLFLLDAPPNHEPVQLLGDGATLVLSVSGGKDSDAMCHHLLHRQPITSFVSYISTDGMSVCRVPIYREELHMLFG